MAAIDPRIVIEEFLDSHDLEFEAKDGNTFLITLPGEKKLQTHCALIVGDHSLSINAFVIRKPDENEAAVHAWCMGLYHHDGEKATSRAAEKFGTFFGMSTIATTSIEGSGA